MPNSTDTLSKLMELRLRSSQFIEKCELLCRDGLRLRDGSLFVKSANECLDIAAIDFALEAEPQIVRKLLHSALSELQHAFELGYYFDTQELLQYFCVALIVDDISFASFIASSPLADTPGMSIDVNQARILFTLLREQRGLVEGYLDELNDMLDEDAVQTPQPSGHSLQRATNQVLASLDQNNVFEFGEALNIRLNLLRKEKSLHPRDQWDLIGLGICQLALRRGMPVTVQHQYLPLELLISRR